MLFASFCWHKEDHNLYSINYLHHGASKTWHVVPASSEKAFQRALKQSVPRLFEEVRPCKPLRRSLPGGADVRGCDTGPRHSAQPHHAASARRMRGKWCEHMPGAPSTAWLPSDAAPSSPGVELLHTVQHAGEFIVTFPAAFHSGFSHGYNCAEAVNIGDAEWLAYGRSAVESYRVGPGVCDISEWRLPSCLPSDPPVHGQAAGQRRFHTRSCCGAWCSAVEALLGRSMCRLMPTSASSTRPASWRRCAAVAHMCVWRARWLLTQRGRSMAGALAPSGLAGPARVSAHAPAAVRRLSRRGVLRVWHTALPGGGSLRVQPRDSELPAPWCVFQPCVSPQPASALTPCAHRLHPVRLQGPLQAAGSAGGGCGLAAPIRSPTCCGHPAAA